MNKASSILITGANGMVGKRVVSLFKKNGYNQLLTPSSKELDLSNQKEVAYFFDQNEIEGVIHLASKVGGIMYNIENKANILRQNILININVIHNAYLQKVKKFIFLGSSCIFPREAPQPMKEDYLLTGPLEPTNEGYSLSKIIGLKLSNYLNSKETKYLSLMPCNLYGPYDHFFSQDAHVIPSMISKMHQAKEEGTPSIDLWGTGEPKREFLHTDDVADSILYFWKSFPSNLSKNFINIGMGSDISIYDLSHLIKEIVGYDGELKFDSTKPNGMMRKILDTSYAQSLGWNPKLDLKKGLTSTYDWLVKNIHLYQKWFYHFFNEGKKCLVIYELVEPLQQKINCDTRCIALLLSASNDTKSFA